jgi:hypothetical protein
LFDDEEEPGVAAGSLARSGAVLDTVTVVSRRGDHLVVDVTRRGSAGPVIMTTTYRRDDR